MEIVYNDGQLIIGREPLPEGLEESGAQTEAAVPVVTVYSTITTKNAPMPGVDDALYEAALEPDSAYVGVVVKTNQTFTPFIRVRFTGPFVYTSGAFLPFPLQAGSIWYIYSAVPDGVQAAPGLYTFKFYAKTAMAPTGVVVARGTCKFVMRNAPAAQ